jgi:two-component system, chemotaxis family, response regulator PixG
MATKVPATTKLTSYLLSLHERRATGELVITHGKQSTLQWRLYFFLGRLVYATGGVHPVRRWYRGFKYHAADRFSIDWLIRAQSDAELWEVDLLSQALQQGEISPAQFKAIIQSIVQEVMFTLVGQKFVHSQWNAGKQIPQQTVLLSISQVIQEAHQLREQWRESGLGFLQELLSQFSPDLAPVLRRSSPATMPESTQGLIQLMRGQFTFWDMAMELRRSLPEILRALSPLIRQGVVELREIADLPSPCAPIAAPTEVAARALIGCVDDNPLTINAITQILQPYGYKVLGIVNPLQGLAMLLAQKPDLILLDPIMPDTNGYEFCTLLRKSPEFCKTPIVILTRQDGMIDRVRAKLAGASEFLVKPLEPAQVVQVVQRYLKEEPESDLGNRVMVW